MYLQAHHNCTNMSNTHARTGHLLTCCDESLSSRKMFPICVRDKDKDNEKEPRGLCGHGPQIKDSTQIFFHLSLRSVLWLDRLSLSGI